VAGNYVDSLESYLGCDSIVLTELSVLLPPIITAFLDTTINKGSSVQLGVVGADSYVWTPNYSLSCDDCQYPIASPQVTTSYFVEGSFEGCSSFDTITITVNDIYTFLWIPNSFTPNGDLLNDEFVIAGENIKEFKILLFNRWGELLFQSNNIGNCWGGFYKGKKVPSGVYVYKVEVLSENSENIEKFGHINLMR
jgi:gliding motility-associated-like protein